MQVLFEKDSRPQKSLAILLEEVVRNFEKFAHWLYNRAIDQTLMSVGKCIATFRRR